MTYFTNSSSLFFLATNKKNNPNIVNRIFPITHDTLIQLFVSLIQCISHFGQYKIKPYSPLWVSMTSLPKFFTSAPMSHPNTFSLSLIGGLAMVTVFQALSLVTRTHGLLSFPACSLAFQKFITLHAFATSRSLFILIKPCSILLKFIFQYIATLYLFYHCISMFISYVLCIKTWQT